MFTVKSLITKRDEIKNFSKKYVFSSFVIFKGFNKFEEHNFNALVSCKEVEKSEASDSETRRQSNLTNEVEKLINLEVKILVPAQMNSDFMDQLDCTNSVDLLSENFHGNLLNVFGLDWEFSTNYPSYDSGSEEELLNVSASIYDDGWQTTENSIWSSLPKVDSKEELTLTADEALRFS